MRLKSVEQGPHLPDMPRMARRLPDVVRVLRYRPELFGGAYGAVLQDAMRGPSDWSVPERELFAAYVSHINKCDF